MSEIVVVQPQRLGDRCEHLGGGVVVATLFEADQVVDADPRKGRQFCPPEPGRTPPRRGRQPDVSRTDRLATGTQEPAELAIDHGHHSAWRRGAQHGPGGTSLEAASPPAADSPMIDDMTDTVLTQLPLKPGSWALDAAHARVGFAVRHLGVAKVRGRFDDIDAKLTVGATPEETAVEATIGIASIDTGNRDRDADVLSAELLDVELGGIADFFDGTRHAGFEARGELRRKDFGIDFGPLNALLGDAVKIALDLEFIEPS